MLPIILSSEHLDSRKETPSLVFTAQTFQKASQINSIAGVARLPPFLPQRRSQCSGANLKAPRFIALRLLSSKSQVLVYIYSMSVHLYTSTNH